MDATTGAGSYAQKTVGTHSNTASGSNSRLNNEGAFPYSEWIGMEAITDGTSSVLLFGEITGGSCKKRTATSSTAYNGCFNGDNWVRGNGLGSVKEISQGLNINGDETGFGYLITPFNSEHSGIVNFSKADGSVAPLAETTDIYHLKRLANRCDGIVVNP
jgi:hypothetical protein